MHFLIKSRYWSDVLVPTALLPDFTPKFPPLSASLGARFYRHFSFLVQVRSEQRNHVCESHSSLDFPVRFIHVGFIFLVNIRRFPRTIERLARSQGWFLCRSNATFRCIGPKELWSGHVAGDVLLMVILRLVEKLLICFMITLIVLGLCDVEIRDPSQFSINVSFLHQFGIFRHSRPFRLIFLIRIDRFLQFLQ